MTSKHLGWFLSGSLLLVLAGCDVSIGKCDRDAGDCDVNFDEDDDDDDEIDSGTGDGDVDGGDELDAGADADTETDSDAGPDASEPEEPVFSGEPLTLEGFCDALRSRRAAWEQLIDDCECSFADANTLRDQFDVFGAESSDGCIGSNQTLIDGKKVTYSDEAAGACADAFLKSLEAAPAECPAEGFRASYFAANIGHGSPSLVQLPACRAAFAGTLSLGAQCTTHLECKGDLRCVTTAGGGAGATKTCSNARSAGSACTGNAECVAGTTCVGSNAGGGKICSATLSYAGNCGSNFECEAGRVCDEGKCVASQESALICEAF